MGGIYQRGCATERLWLADDSRQQFIDAVEFPAQGVGLCRESLSEILSNAEYDLIHLRRRYIACASQDVIFENDPVIPADTRAAILGQLSGGVTTGIG
jgi:hypothetical protein